LGFAVTVSYLSYTTCSLVVCVLSKCHLLQAFKLKNIMKDKVFISYAHVDQEETDWLKKLKKHLGFFERKHLLSVWEDTQLATGSNPRQAIIDAIAESKIAVLLVGPAFLGSNFINDVELPRILEAARADGLQIFPLVTNFCSYLKSDLKDVWAFNDYKRPLEALTVPEQNKVLAHFCNALEEAYNKPVGTPLSEILVDEDHPFLFKKVELTKKRLTCCNFTSHKGQAVCAGFEPELMNVDIENKTVESITSVNTNARCIFQFPGSSIYLVGYDNGDVYSFNSDLVNFKKCFSCKSSVFSISYNFHSQTLLTSERSGEVNEWVVSNTAEVVGEEEAPLVDFLKQLTRHASAAFMVISSDKLNIGASIGADGTMATMDFRSGKVKLDGFYKGDALYCVAIADNGTMAIGASQGKVFLVDSNYKRKSVTCHVDTVRALALTPNAKWLFTGSKDKTVKITNLVTNRMWLLFKCQDYVYDVKFSPSYNQLLVCDGAGTVFALNFIQPIEEMSNEQMDRFLLVALAK
jgi:TIR domain/WD domain, G-beta repeat